MIKDVKVGRVSFGLIGDQSQLTPEAAQAFKECIPSIASMLEFAQSPAGLELRKQYLKGNMSSESLSIGDWFGAPKESK